MRDDSQKSPNVNYKIINSFCHVFYPPAFAEASARQVGKAEDTASPLLPAGPKPWHPSSVASTAEGGKAGQGFAVCDYSFTLDAVDLQHPRLLQR
jgi:hypothetical protein